MMTLLPLFGTLLALYLDRVAYAAYITPGDSMKMKPMKDTAREGNLILDLPILLKEIDHSFIDRYDVWLLDQFGVLHDGTNPLPGAIATVEELLRRKKKVVITSNTSQRASVAMQRFKKLGFPPVHDFITSGEFCWFHLKKNYRGKKAIIFSWKGPLGGEAYLEGTDIELTDDVEEADVLIFHGSETLNSKEISLRETGKLDPEVVHVLKRAKERGLTAVCANQDRKAMWTSGEHYMPGILEEIYRTKYGGKTEFFGKPDLEFFNAAVELGSMAVAAGDKAPLIDQPLSPQQVEEKYGNYASYGDDLECHTQDSMRQRRRDLAIKKRIRCIHVGDSLEHDVHGASNAGLDVIFVTKHGVHKKDLHSEKVSDETQQKIDLLNNVCDLCEKEASHRPSHIVESFRLHH